MSQHGKPSKLVEQVETTVFASEDLEKEIKKELEKDSKAKAQEKTIQELLDAQSPPDSDKDS